MVLAADTSLGTESGEFGESLATAPVESVLDAVEALMDADSMPFKRLPESVDAGFAYVSDTYVGIAEKIIGKKIVLSDNPKQEIIDILRDEFALID